MAWALRELQQAEALRLNKRVASACRQVSWHCLCLGRNTEASAQIDRALSLLGPDDPQRVEALHVRANVHERKGRYQQAIVDLEAACALAENLGLLLPLGRALTPLAAQYLHSGSTSLARQRALEALSLAIEPDTASYVRSLLAQICLAEGSAAEARVYVDEALRIASEMQHPFTHIVALTVRCQVALAMGDINLAQVSIEGALDLLSPGHDPSTRCRVLLQAGEVDVATGKQDRASKRLREVQQIREQHGVADVQVTAAIEGLEASLRR